MVGISSASSTVSAQNAPTWKVLGDTNGAPHGCSAADGVRAVDAFVKALGRADSIGLARSLAPHFVFSSGKWTPADTFFVGRSVAQVLGYARKRARAHDRILLDALWFNGWHKDDLWFGPIWFSRTAPALGL